MIGVSMKIFQLISGVSNVKKSYEDYVLCAEEKLKNRFSISAEKNKKYYFKIWISSVYNLYDSLSENLKEEDFRGLFECSEIIELKKLMSKKYVYLDKKYSIKDLMQVNRNKYAHPRRNETFESAIIETINPEEIVKIQEFMTDLIDKALNKCNKEELITFAITAPQNQFGVNKIIDSFEFIKKNETICNNESAIYIVNELIEMFKTAFISENIIDIQQIEKFELRIVKIEELFASSGLKALFLQQPGLEDILNILMELKDVEILDISKFEELFSKLFECIMKNATLNNNAKIIESNMFN